MSNLFTDGGCIKTNPSTYGGVWAWCLVENDKIVRYGSGIIEPPEVMPKLIQRSTITNNLSELYAAVRALEAMKPDWNGILYTDSLVTLRRITSSPSFAGIPDDLREQTLRLRQNRLWKAKLVGGHPTKDELKNGYRKRNGLPVSAYNIWVDNECRRLAWDYLERKANNNVSR